MTASSIGRHLLHRGLHASGHLYKISFTANHRRLLLQWVQEHISWQADWHQVVFSDESRFNLFDHDDRICVRRHAGERCLLECVIKRHSCLTPGVIVWGAISYHGRSNLLPIDGNISNRYVREVLQPEVVPFLQGIPGAIFQQDNVAKTVRDFCSAQHMQLLPWPAYSSYMSPIEHVWDLVGRRLAHNPRPAASKAKLLLCIQAIHGILVHKQTFKICLTPCHVV
ncbi:transposable element Tcb2 transposase [Trichonephila clavipes]|nr:transposable element Tcb2 transposase [Trichonephila clavipes]